MSADVEERDLAPTPEEYAALPARCPSWCVGGPEGHRTGLEETGDVLWSSAHLSVDLNGFTPTLHSRPGDRERHTPGGWQVQMRREMHARPLVEVRLHRWVEAPGQQDAFETLNLDLTTGEARTLAAQLLHLADRADLADG